MAIRLSVLSGAILTASLALTGLGQAQTIAVPANHLVAIGVGQELPLDATDPKAKANRRVQLINLGLAN